MDLGEEGRLTFAERGAQLPMTIGHEIAGIVEAIGDKVKNVSTGQQVLVFPWIGCGSYQACRENRESDCSVMRIVGLKQKGGFVSITKTLNTNFLRTNSRPKSLSNSQIMVQTHFPFVYMLHTPLDIFI